MATAPSPQSNSHRSRNIWITVIVVFVVILVGASVSLGGFSNGAKTSAPSIKQFIIQEDDVAVIFTGQGVWVLNITNTGNVPIASVEATLNATKLCYTASYCINPNYVYMISQFLVGNRLVSSANPLSGGVTAYAAPTVNAETYETFSVTVTATFTDGSTQTLQQTIYTPP